ncbi:MAG: hypothetical protein HBSAPP03_27170 [Phycisphaerae bacterium]|nr:MAG: hypothetical protein HBSAPP03_27170 [Phycisphaerae bacterium]
MRGEATTRRRHRRVDKVRVAVEHRGIGQSQGGFTLDPTNQFGAPAGRDRGPQGQGAQGPFRSARDLLIAVREQIGAWRGETRIPRIPSKFGQ